MRKKNTTDTSIETSIKKISKKELLVMLESETPTREEVRHLVNIYYQIQDNRIRTNSQIRAVGKDVNDSMILQFFKSEYESLENQIKTAIEIYTEMDPVAKTLKKITGIGPIIAAGLVANFDITKANTAGAYWRFCGIDPTVEKMKKGKTLSYNKDLKTLVVYKLGESFIKVQNKDSDIYGKIYKEWKALYEERNENGGFVENAKKKLAECNMDKSKETYKIYEQGKLPPAHIYSMARRKPLMLFISHLFDLQYMLHHHKKSPVPYVIAYCDHVHTIKNPLVKLYEEEFGKIEIND